MNESVEKIQDCEEAIENGLAALEKKDFSNVAITRALKFLIPKGFRPVVEFREGGRKKRRTAAADNWAPSNGEILIRFDPVTEESDAVMADREPETVSSEGALEEICRALADAEIGRSFVALKWFRDDFLPSTGYAWTKTPEDRYAILTKAIASGRILTAKVTNPRAPQYPTTTVRVNRQRHSQSSTTPAQRFVPVPVSGEPLSRTILSDRGQR